METALSPSMHYGWLFYCQDVIRAARVAMEYHLQFEKDVVVDMTCFRRW